MQQILSISVRQIDNLQGSPLTTQQNFYEAEPKARGPIFMLDHDSGNALIAGGVPKTTLDYHSPTTNFFHDSINPVAFRCTVVFQALGLSFQVCSVGMVGDSRIDGNQLLWLALGLLFSESRPQWFPKAVESLGSGRFATSEKRCCRSRPLIRRIGLTSCLIDDMFIAICQ
jgi:hypothetical protein